MRGAISRGVAIVALVATAVQAGSHNHGGRDGSDAEAKLQVLRDNVQKAMLELYMQNAQMHAEDKLSLLGAAAPAPAGAISRGSQPFGQLESFGREDTAAELTEASIDESNRMIDQIERAVVSETKRSMFRALTRLRGTTISSFDGMANSQSANIDEYTRRKQWTKTHEVNHLAKQESNVESWAFPNSEPSFT